MRFHVIYVAIEMVCFVFEKGVLVWGTVYFVFSPKPSGFDFGPFAHNSWMDDPLVGFCPKMVKDVANDQFQPYKTQIYPNKSTRSKGQEAPYRLNFWKTISVL